MFPVAAGTNRILSRRPAGRLAVHAADVRQLAEAVAAARAAVATADAPEGKSWPQCMTVSPTVTPPDATASKTRRLGRSAQVKAAAGRAAYRKAPPRAARTSGPRAAARISSEDTRASPASKISVGDARAASSFASSAAPRHRDAAACF